MCEDYEEMTIDELWEVYKGHSRILFFDRAVGGHGIVQWALDEVNMILDELKQRKNKGVDK